MAGNYQFGRRVEVQPGRPRQGLGGDEGRLQSSDFELLTKPDGSSPSKNDLRIGAVRESRECLVTDDPIATKLDDRLEDWVECFVLDDGGDVFAAPSGLGPLGDVATDDHPSEIGELY